MKTNTGTKGFAVGSHVIVDGRGPRIHEVIDARLRNGAYAYLVAPMAPWGAHRAAVFEVLGSDVREVRS